MPDHLTDATSTVGSVLAPDDSRHSPTALEQAIPAPRRRRRSRRTDWRLGGSTVRPWNLTLLSVALISVGVGVVGGALIGRIGSPWAGAASTLVLWVGFGVPIVVAFARSRPVGLLRVRALDVLYALVLGGALRMLQGVLEGPHALFPTVATLDGALPTGWWLSDALPAVLVAPVLEEFFFRGVLLIVVYQLLRRSAGSIAAAFAALLVSTGAFILMHLTGGPLSMADAISLGLVGSTCALLVLLTGRIWGAVLTHVVFNATYFALVLAGASLR